ncbi:MAG: polyprenol monophosphomannose synthase [Promethearchaeota archaeon]
MKIGIIIPTYNEKDNIKILLDKLLKLNNKINAELEILVVDDNSPDGTGVMVEHYMKSHKNIWLILRKKKSGLGSAIVDGMKKLLKSDVNYVITMDADMSHRPEYIAIFINRIINQPLDLIQASRYIKGGGVKGWGIHRWMISICANLFIRTIFRTGIKDNTTNFRMYSRRIANCIIKNTQCIGYEWIVESLIIAKRFNAKIKEIPIIFYNRKTGKSKLTFSKIARWLINIFLLFQRIRHVNSLQ